MQHTMTHAAKRLCRLLLCLALLPVLPSLGACALLRGTPSYQAPSGGLLEYVLSLDPDAAADESDDNSGSGNELSHAPSREKSQATLDEVDKLIGLASVKKALQLTLYEVSTSQANTGGKKHQNVHLAFAGAPGTGKSVVAEILTRALYNAGAVKFAKPLIATHADLIAEYVGQTAGRTRTFLEKGRGGVIVVDHIDNLLQARGALHNFGGEALDVIRQSMEAWAKDTVFILIGDKTSIDELIRRDSGIGQRLAQTVLFPELNAEQLAEVLQLEVAKTPYMLDAKVAKYLRPRLAGIARRKNGGNAAAVHTLVAQAVARADLRRSESGAANSERDDTRRSESGAANSERDDTRRNDGGAPAERDNARRNDRGAATILERADFDPSQAAANLRSPEERVARAEAALGNIKKLVGLEAVWQQLHTIVMALAYDILENPENSLASHRNLHLAFVGPPGTGKTTVAQYFGEALRELGVLPSDTFVTRQPADFLATAGETTSEKARQVLEHARGGLTFIDEAYGLASRYDGLQALEQLLLFMENEREDSVVILAGYEKDMEGLYNVNPGFRRRIAETVVFAAYDSTTLTTILDKMLAKEKFQLDAKARQKVTGYFTVAARQRDFGNAGAARTISERAISAWKARQLQNRGRGGGGAVALRNITCDDLTFLD